MLWLSPVAAADRDVDAELELKPRLCVLAREEPRCTTGIDIEWQLEEPLWLCLFNLDTDDPLQCWNNQQRGLLKYQVDTDHSLTFQLRQQQDDALLVSEIFRVVREQARYRYQRRKPWNFF